MKNREVAESTEKEANELLDKYTALADQIFEDVKNRL
jgi:hypothetical protein